MRWTPGASSVDAHAAALHRDAEGSTTCSGRSLNRRQAFNRPTRSLPAAGSDRFAATAGFAAGTVGIAAGTHGFPQQGIIAGLPTGDPCQLFIAQLGLVGSHQSLGQGIQRLVIKVGGACLLRQSGDDILGGHL